MTWMWSYLHWLVIPAVCPILLKTAAVQHHKGSVGIIGLQATGLIKANHTQTALNQGQRVPVGLIWMEKEAGEICSGLSIWKWFTDFFKLLKVKHLLRPCINVSLACAHSVLPSDVRIPNWGSLSSVFSAIFMIFSSWDKISVSLSCLLFATMSNTKNYEKNRWQKSHS